MKYATTIPEDQGMPGAFVDLNLHDRSVSGDAHSGDESPFLEFIAHWDSNPTTYIFDWSETILLFSFR